MKYPKHRITEETNEDLNAFLEGYPFWCRSTLGNVVTKHTTSQVWLVTHNSLIGICDHIATNILWSLNEIH